jgi:hypothetical protein
MRRTKVVPFGIAALAAIAAACTPSTPLTPTPANTTTSTTLSDGTSLKATAPTPQSPINDTKVNGSIVLTATSAAPAFGGANPGFQYRFQVFDPSNVKVIDQVSGGPSLALGFLAKGDARHTWKVRAEYNGAIGPWSSTASFISPQPFDMHQATILSNPPDLANWPETAKITFIQFQPDALIVDFTKRTGPGAWVNMPFFPGDPPGGGGIQYTLGMCENIGNHWYCSAVIQFWEGRELEAAAAPWSIPQTWYYDPARWGPMAGYLPADGELVGIFVTLGNTRGILSSAGLLATERSNVALVPFELGYNSIYQFGAGRLPYSSQPQSLSKLGLLK